MKATPDPEILPNTKRPPKNFTPVKNDRYEADECGEPVAPRSDPPSGLTQPDPDQMSDTTLRTLAAWRSKQRQPKTLPLHECIARSDFGGTSIGR